MAKHIVKMFLRTKNVAFIHYLLSLFLKTNEKFKMMVLVPIGVNQIIFEVCLKESLESRLCLVYVLI